MEYRPNLKISLADLQSDIDDFVDEGEKLYSTLRDPEISKEENDSWRQRVSAMLSYSFKSEYYSTEFSRASKVSVSWLNNNRNSNRHAQSAIRERKRLKQQLDWLKSFEQGLKYIDVDLSQSDPHAKMAYSESKEVFIVHGHDVEMKESVARFVSKLGFLPVILHEKADLNRTIIEKFESHSSSATYAVVLLSPDDQGGVAASDKDLSYRARQNVVLELGYFLGSLGRSRVSSLVRGDVETPGDYDGVLYTKYDADGAWQLKLAANMKAAGLDIELNNLIT